MTMVYAHSVQFSTLTMIPLTIDQKKARVELSRGRSNRETAMEFNMRYPERIINKSSVQRVLASLKSTGSLYRKKRNTAYALSNSTEFVEKVRDHVENHPLLSIRQLALHFRCSGYVIQKILRKILGFFPYKKQIHQLLLPQDLAKRVEFCRVMDRWCTGQPHIMKKILWSDEKQFTMTASFNRQNHR